MRISILVVEDEVLLAMDLQNRLIKQHEYDVTIAHNYEQAVACLLQQNFDFLIIDIFLNTEKSGIDLAKYVRKEFNIPFIFLTSHADKKTVEEATAVKPNAYLLKPYHDRQIVISIELALANYSQNQTNTDSLNDKILPIKDSLFLKQESGSFARVSYSQIKYLEADSNYTRIIANEDVYVYAVVLKKIKNQLPPDTFLRIHRSYIINITHITGFEGNQILIGNNKLPVSKAHRPEVFRLFNTL